MFIVVDVPESSDINVRKYDTLDAALDYCIKLLNTYSDSPMSEELIQGTRSHLAQGGTETYQEMSQLVIKQF